jgi:hypothetical protein
MGALLVRVAAEIVTQSTIFDLSALKRQLLIFPIKKEVTHEVTKSNYRWFSSYFFMPVGYTANPCR